MYAKKFASVALVILIALLGFIISPPSHSPGKYKAEINIDLDYNAHAVIIFYFNLTSEEVEGKLVKYSNTTMLILDNSIRYFTIIATGYDSYQLKPGTKVDFTLTIYLDNEKIFVKPTKITGVVTLPNGKREKALILSYGEELIFRFAVRYQSHIAIVTLFVISFLWLSEIIPLVASALLVPVIAVLFGLMSPKEALSPMFDPIIALFFGGFLLAKAMNKHYLDRRFAFHIISKVGTPQRLLFIVMLATCFLSFWMSNTAVAALMLPIAIATLKVTEKDKGTNYSKAIILGVAYSATVGGMGTLIGTPPNAIAVSFLKYISGIELSFLDWMIYALPFTFLMLVVAFFYLNFVYSISEDVSKGRISISDNVDIIQMHLVDLGDMKREEKLTITVLAVTVSLWLTQKLPISIFGWRGHGISAGIIALLSAVVLLVLGILDPKDIREISWETLLIFGGGLVLGEMLIASGMSEWIVTHFISIRNPFIILIILGFLSLIVTAFASNTASAVILLPLAIPLGAALGINPVIPALVVALGTSIDFALPIGTPPTMLAYSTGYVKFREIVKVGFPLMIMGVLLLVFLMTPIWLLLI